MKNSFPYTWNRGILIAAISLIIFTYSTTPYTQAQACNWKTQFCGPQIVAPPTQNINFLLRLIRSLPTTDTTCAAGEVINGFKANGEMLCTSVPALRGPQGDKGDPGSSGSTIISNTEPIPGWCSTIIRNYCTVGTLIDAADTPSHYRWVCEGRNGGSNMYCSEAKGT